MTYCMLSGGCGCFPCGDLALYIVMLQLDKFIGNPIHYEQAASVHPPQDLFLMG